MRFEPMLTLLQQEGRLTVEPNGVYRCKEEGDLTLFVDMGHEILPVTRVQQLRIRGEVLLVLTHRGEEFYITADTAIRVAKWNELESTRLPNAGFYSR